MTISLERQIVMRQFFTIIGVLLLASNLVSVVDGSQWPEWRGPGRNSVVPGGGFPQTWSEDSNIVWKVSLPGWGTSSPAIWDEQVFVTYEDGGTNGLICLGRDGKQRWKTVVGKSVSGRNRKASGANPSPITDGRHVYVYFKSGELACVNTAGRIVWQTNLQQAHGDDHLVICYYY